MPYSQQGAFPRAALELKIDATGKNAEPVELLAEVVWQKKTEMGFLTGLKLGS